MRVLLELRPALLGHAGIPQETRLLFRALTRIEGVEVEGLIQSGARVVAPGLPASPRGGALSADARINRLSRVVVSLQQTKKPLWAERLSRAWAATTAPTAMILRHLAGMSQELTRFDATHFRDFVWRTLFAKTLPFADFEAVTTCGFRLARVPWETMHVCALLTRFLGRALYPRLDTRDFDVMIAETPYPGTVTKGTHLVVRYHDAIPLLMPHTITDRFFHQAFHYHALRRNVQSGAWFACVSESTRRDLLSVFPQVEPRAVTIHNMVSHHYFLEESSPARIPEIIETRRHPKIGRAPRRLDTPPMRSGAEALPFDYLLVVSTIEPRKNHATLLAAWEQLRAERFFHLKLVVVGAFGWDYKAIVNRFRPWLERGELFILTDVPAPELRLLYRHARATICPSYAEGFDFSGIEAMRCGGVVAASDIGVHREIFGEAAGYFNPYSAAEMANAIGQLIDPGNAALREELVARGASTSALYLPDRILPQWRQFLESLTAPTRVASATSGSTAVPRALLRDP